jgi:hypothetical protein
VGYLIDTTILARLARRRWGRDLDHEALALYRSHADTPPLDLANAIRPLALLKYDAGEAEEARRLFEEARDLYALANVQEGVAGCSTWLARLNRQGTGDGR